MKFASAVIGKSDRCRVELAGRDVLLAVADGSGGTRGGAEAAQAVVDALAPTDDWPGLLFRLDRELMERGWTTAMMAVIHEGRIRGASVGDTKAWLVESGRELTARQEAKPLLGSGAAFPIAFDVPLDGTLLVATDGLWKYARWTEVAHIASAPDLDEAAARLVALVRLPAGDVQDDVCVVLCR